MAKGNPYGNLAGFTDQSKPGWQERAIAAVEESTKKEATRSRETITKVRGSAEFRERLDQACAVRGVNRSVYVRRAAAAFMAVDLGLPFEEILTGLSPAWTELGKSFTPFREAPHDDGEGHGLWHITGLE
jgi:hypothetical protein